MYSFLYFQFGLFLVHVFHFIDNHRLLVGKTKNQNDKVYKAKFSVSRCNVKKVKKTRSFLKKNHSDPIFFEECECVHEDEEHYFFLIFIQNPF